MTNKTGRTVYELILKLGSKDTTNEEIIEMVGNYPLLSHMVLTGKDNSMLLEIMKVVPEVTCPIVESRLRRNFDGNLEGVEGTDGKEGKVQKGRKGQKEGTEGKEVRNSVKVEHVKVEVEKPSKPTKPTKPVTNGESKPKPWKVEVEDLGSDTDYESLTTVQCYELCRKRQIPGVKTKWKKEDYVSILMDYDHEHEIEEDEMWEDVV